MMPASHQQRKKPHPQFKHDSARCWVERWDVRMAEQITRIVVHLSTDTGGDSWDQFELGGGAAYAFNKAVKHMKFKRQFGVLPQGVYTITVPGTDHKHSFEVE